MKKIIGTFISFLMLFYSSIYFFFTRPRLIRLYADAGAEGPYTYVFDIILGVIFLGALLIIFFIYKKSPKDRS